MKGLLLASIALGFLFPIKGVYSQEIYELDLQKSIEIAKQKSHQMLILNQVLAQAGFELKAATSRLKTHIDLNLTVPDYTETIRQFEDSAGITFYPVQQLRYNGSVMVSQPLPTDGQFYVSTGLDNLMDYYKDERLTRLDVRLGFVQPLSAFYVYNRIRTEFKKAKLNYELSLRSLRRAELDLIYETSQAFYNLVATRERENIANQVLERQQDAYEIAQNKYEAGLIREVEALQMEVDLGEGEIVSIYGIGSLSYWSSLGVYQPTLGENVEVEYATITFSDDSTKNVAGLTCNTLNCSALSLLFWISFAVTVLPPFSIYYL